MLGAKKPDFMGFFEFKGNKNRPKGNKNRPKGNKNRP